MVSLFQTFQTELKNERRRKTKMISLTKRTISCEVKNKMKLSISIHHNDLSINENKWKSHNDTTCQSANSQFTWVHPWSCVWCYACVMWLFFVAMFARWCRECVIQIKPLAPWSRVLPSSCSCSSLTPGLPAAAAGAGPHPQPCIENINLQHSPSPATKAGNISSRCFTVSWEGPSRI